MPRQLRILLSSAGTGPLVAYTNSEIYLVGPSGMRCSGLVGADGGSRIILWRGAGAAPAQHSRGDGLTLLLDPACAGCRAADACPFFRSFAAGLGFPCASGVPAGEHVQRLSRRAVYFTDDPGMPGDGWPSGGYDPATGVVGLQGSSAQSAAYRATCTLPLQESAACAAAMLNVLRRYGTAGYAPA